MKRVIFSLLAAAASTSCFSLDGFVWNPRHCSLAETEGWQDSFDCTERNMCTRCEDPLPFASVGILPENVEQIPVSVEGGVETVDSYFITSSGARPNDVILYAHGNFGGVEHYLDRVGFMAATGAHVYAVDYRGFGKSSTTEEPDEPTFMADALVLREALTPLLEARGLTGARIHIVGFSAGALPAIEMARAQPPCSLILENPWPSIQEFADDSSFIGIPQSFVTNGGWDNISKIPEVNAPLLHIHGEEDTTVRIELGEKLFAAANEPKRLVKIAGAGHGNGGDDVPRVMGEDVYVQTVADFIDDQSCE